MTEPSSLPLDGWTEVVIDGVQVDSVGPATSHPDLSRLVLAYPPATVRGAATPALPRRGDAVEAWLKAQRDLCFGHASTYNVVDGLLDQYRLHADTGTPLNQHVCEGGNVDDCYGCYEQEAQR